MLFFFFFFDDLHLALSHLSLNLTPPSLFKKPLSPNTDNDGKLTGADAVAFFERSGLPRPTLAKVWTLADAGRRGFLDKKSFAKAMELIGIAQRSSGVDDLSAEAYAEAAARADLDPPVLEGVGGKVATGSDDGGSGGGGAGPSPRGTAATPAGGAAASPSGSGAPSPQQYAYAHASSSAANQGNGNQKGSKGNQPSMKTITGVVDGLKQIYFSKGSLEFLLFSVVFSLQF